ncbi:hypothetical protein PYW08_010558 [Mythimna loreyi]|uniref:Uncharacterized protein n=1 Tax=Mythimna loreyi TaxID=667449 RepID=A0ACC2Q5E4_9NEOP|nr:hypothetical protein PYW08_010558 [Mythimna loreyi]
MEGLSLVKIFWTYNKVWCVAAAGHSGAVAVFPRRTAYPSPAPARHTVRALHNKTTAVTPAVVLLLLAMIALRLQ